MVREPDDTGRERGPDADPHEVAREICLRQLTARARTRHQLADTLSKRDVPDEVATAVLDRFVEVGLIDDDAYARMFTAARHREKGDARRSIALQLRRRGIEGDTAERALAQIDAGDERERALQLARTKARSLRRLEPAVATRRLVGVLGRRGYSPSLAWSVTREVLGEPADGPDHPDHLDSGED